MNTWHPKNCGFGREYRFHVCYNLSTQSYELRVVEDIPGGNSMRAELRWVEVDPRSRIPPTLELHDRDNQEPLQDLFNALWAAGIRPPKEEINVDAVVQAKDENLDDLRALLYHQLGISK